MTTTPNYILRNPAYTNTILTTSNTTALFTGIPSGVRRIVIDFRGVSSSATSRFAMTIGNASLETTGYLSVATFVTATVGNNNSTADFLIVNSLSAADAIDGIITLIKADDVSNLWVMSGLCGSSTGQATLQAVGSKAITGGELQRLAINLSAGNFDAGLIRVDAFYT